MEKYDVTFERTISLPALVDELIAEVESEYELEPGATAGPAPGPEIIVARILDVLGTYGVLQGAHFQLAQYARDVLKK